MSSVPYLHGKGIKSKNADLNTDHNLSNYYRSSLSSKLLEIRHIKSIIIKRIRPEPCDYHKNSHSNLPNSINRTKSEKIYESEHNSQPSEIQLSKTLETKQKSDNNITQKKIRKGNSSSNLHKSFTSGTIHNDMANLKKIIKDDNYLESQTSILRTTLFQPPEICRQHDFQKINEDTFFECFYTINDFLNIDRPYYISRLFPYYTEIADELELHIFSKSATINLFVKNSSKDWNLLKQYHLKLSLLINLGDDLDLIESKLRYLNNLLLLKLSDDCYYILPNDNIPYEIVKSLKINYIERMMDKFDNFQFKQRSCSYDQIMTINNYSRCIHDLLRAKLILNDKITEELKNDNSSHKIIDAQVTLSTSTSHLNKALESKISDNYQLKNRILQLKKRKENLETQIMKLKYPSQPNKLEMNFEIANETLTLQNENIKLLYLINLEKSRIASLIQYIFPMKEIQGKHDFSLFNTCFPSSLIPHTRSLEESEHNTIIPISIVSSTIIQRLTQISRPHSERLNSLIGYISLIVLTVADIFNIPLRYPIRELGSNSYINDPISDFNNISTEINSKNFNSNGSNSNYNTTSIRKSTTIYPLFICQNATLAVKFTYALLLLRKDLEQLYEIEGIVKIEEFNLLIACKIWLKCVEGYADSIINNGNINDINVDYVEEDIEAITENNNNILDNNSVISNNIKNDNESDKIDNHDKLSPLLKGMGKLDKNNRRVSNSSKFSKIFNTSIMSDVSNKSTVSGISAISAVSNASSIVNEYNQKLHSDEKIKHIKKHLLKGSGGKI